MLFRAVFFCKIQIGELTTSKDKFSGQCVESVTLLSQLEQQSNALNSPQERLVEKMLSWRFHDVIVSHHNINQLTQPHPNRKERRRHLNNHPAAKHESTSTSENHCN